MTNMLFLLSRSYVSFLFRPAANYFIIRWRLCRLHRHNSNKKIRSHIWLELDFPFVWHVYTYYIYTFCLFTQCDLFSQFLLRRCLWNRRLAFCYCSLSLSFSHSRQAISHHSEKTTLVYINQLCLDLYLTICLAFFAADELAARGRLLVNYRQKFAVFENIYSI